MHTVITEEQKLLRDTVRRLAQENIAPRAPEIDDSGEYPWDIFELLKTEGLLGIFFPKEYGGGGKGVFDFALVAEELGSADVACANIVINQGLGSYPIILAGTPEQKEKYLPKLASGEYIAAFSFTEPDAGSDAAHIKTEAVFDGDYYVINGTKCFCSQGNIADVILLFASTNLEAEQRGISGFILEKGTPGFSVGKLENKMGVKGSPTAELIFDDCRIPRQNLIGKENQGFMLGMTTYDRSRPVVGSMCVGLARAALECCVRYGKNKFEGEKPIVYKQGITLMIADMATQIEAARQLVYRAAREIDNQAQDTAKLGAMAKYYASDVAMKVTVDAVRIMGKDGYTKAFPVERYLRDAKLTQIVEGTNQIQRIVVGRSIIKEIL